jgi:Tfp pilus assembly protein PilV
MRKHSLLPVLIVLFLVSYGLMALLAVQQDRTISSQRSMITSLLSDSTELSSLKGKILTKQQAQAGARARSQTQTPSTQAPMTQAPMTQAPMTQDAPGGNAQSSHNAGKPRKSVPPKPPLGIADIVDGRRIVKTI